MYCGRRQLVLCPISQKIIQNKTKPRWGAGQEEHIQRVNSTTAIDLSSSQSGLETNATDDFSCQFKGCPQNFKFKKLDLRNWDKKFHRQGKPVLGSKKQELWKYGAVHYFPSLGAIVIWRIKRLQGNINIKSISGASSGL